MTVLTEGHLQLTVNSAIVAWKFDDVNHGLSHCMKAVDFIIELNDCYLYIEFKDPQAPLASQQVGSSYLESFRKGQLDEDLKYKYRDSYLYEWASGRADKPIDYLVLVALDTLRTPLLRHRRRELERKLTVLGPSGQPWHQPFVRSCAVFNLDTWNRNLPDLPIVRIP
jgi:hypothetical protein